MAVKRIACTLALLAWASVPAIAGPGITGLTPGNSVDNPNGTYGFAFSLNNDETIRALGVYDAGRDGLVSDAAVGIWDETGTTLLTSTVVHAGTTGTLIGDFRYNAIAPLLLNANINGSATYFIGSYDPLDPITQTDSGLDANQPGGVSLDQNLQGVVQFFVLGDGLAFPDLPTNVAGAFLGPNFTTDAVAAALPEPASLVILGAGLTTLASLRRRRVRA
jgi:hypothetical protein